MKKINDTIVAPITNIAVQAVAVLRISGEDAFQTINKIVDKPVPYQKGIFLRRLFSENNLVDEVVITAYTNPHSFTGEDVIEIACHGGILNTNRILKLVLNQGIRMAMKGEFSQRAFLNGKINLIQAEGINDLIHANNELALKIGVENMSGQHNKAINHLKSSLMEIISKIQVSIDYPDYDDVEGTKPEELLALLKEINNQIGQLLFRSQMANKSITGIKTAIIGKTNVGKSSILNSLLNEEKAIVTDVEGTTRDIVEGQISLNGINLNLLDTAGIRQTKDVVESIGIEKSKQSLALAELVLFVINAQQLSDSENQEIFNLLKNKNFILVMNKVDQLSVDEKLNFQKQYPDAVFTSVIQDDVQELITKIQEKYNNEELMESNDLILINVDQISLLEQIQTKTNQAYQNLMQQFPIDIVNVDLTGAWELLNQLIGVEYDEEIIDNIFRKYCLGK